jgi:hypothetical protein
MQTRTIFTSEPHLINFMIFIVLMYAFSLPPSPPCHTESMFLLLTHLCTSTSGTIELCTIIVLIPPNMVSASESLSKLLLVFYIYIYLSLSLESEYYLHALLGDMHTVNGCTTWISLIKSHICVLIS